MCLFFRKMGFAEDGIAEVQNTTWKKPPYLWIKLNTDGIALENPWNIGTCGIRS